MKLRFLTALASVMVAQCNDPVHQAKVDALGGEPNGGSPGPTHRPGQPCLTCHGGQGPSSTDFAVAGTIFQTAERGSPGLSGGTVLVFDSTDTEKDATTNEAGNFYITASDWSPSFPLHDITLDYTGIIPPRPKMHTRVGRDGSCATCHFDPSDPDKLSARDTPGHVYLVLEAADLPGAKP
jgi:hypothetical protein